jgi:hypothetical protein
LGNPSSPQLVIAALKEKFLQLGWAYRAVVVLFVQ